MHYDTIVIGAGSMGMAAGYFLSKSGQKTLLLDAFDPPHSNGSHHGDTRIIRHAYGEGEQYVELALYAQELWEDLEKQSGESLFLQTGVLNVGPKHSDFIQNIISSANRYDLSLDVLNSEEVSHRWKGIKIPNDYIGCFEPASGVLKCETCISTYKKLAVENGAHLAMNQRVSSVELNENEVVVKTPNGTYYANSLIIAAGAWSSGLLSSIGINLPLQPTRKTFAWFQTDEKLYNDTTFPAFSFVTSNGTYYGFPSIDGAGLKVGRHDGGEPIHPSESMRPFGDGDQEDVSTFLETYMTASEHTLTYGKTCMYTMTPDEDFIIDVHPNYSNVAIAAGFSGHGFKFSSAVGHVLSELITNGETNQNISPFSLKRFIKGD